jgi:putative ABC transport system substrate-binding protein
VQQPTVYDLVVNLQTAKALGIAVPESILYRADEVIK